MKLHLHASVTDALRATSHAYIQEMMDLAAGPGRTIDRWTELVCADEADAIV
jgi:hypothetical protein